MSKHTPGPWSVSDAFGSVGAVCYANGFVAFPCLPRSVCDDKEPGESWLDMRDRTKQQRDDIEQEKQANARLIAAAPLMLAALEKIADETAATWVCDVANAAIAAAKGEQ